MTSAEAVKTSHSSTVSAVTTPSVASSVQTPPQTTLSPTEQAAQVRERIESDLQRWQVKFAAAADRGVEDLDGRLQEIIDSLIATSARDHGGSLSKALEGTVEGEISTVRERINALAGSLPLAEAVDDEKLAQDELLQDIRQAAISIRERAHELRQWYNSFDAELARRVSTAVNSTLNILDSVRDLGLQEIGMRWAWMDGVTYKDWEDYHLLKERFDDWRKELSDVGMQHKKMEEARNVANDVLGHGMDVAEDSAKELARLREVGMWKISAREASDNFETRSDPPPTWPKPSDDSESAEVDVTHTEPESSESPTQPADTTPPEAASHSADSYAQDQIEEDEEDSMADEEILDVDEEDSSNQTPRSVAPIPTDSEKADSDGSTTQGRTSEDTPGSAKHAWGVAAAEVVTKQEPILEDLPDDETAELEQARFSAELQSLVSKAGDQYAQVTQAASEVLLGPSSTPGFGEHAVSIGAGQYSRALSAASHVLYSAAEPTRPLDHIVSMASSRLNDGLRSASAQFAHVQATVPPSAPSAQQPALLDAQRRYYEALGLAHDHYSVFVSSASQAVYGTPTPTAGMFHEFIEDSRSRYSEASSLASSSLAAAMASVSSVIAPADTGKAQGMIEDASSRYSAVLSAASTSLSLASVSASSGVYGTTPGPLDSLSSQASENWVGLVSRVSEQVYGTQEPYAQHVVNNLASRYDDIQDLVSELLVGKEPPFTESVMSRLHAMYATPLASASSYISNAYDSAHSAAPAYITDPPKIEDILHSANEQLQAAVDAASARVYGTPKGTFEKATSGAADAYSTASSRLSEAVHGSETGYVEVASIAVEDAFSSAASAMSNAVYPTPMGPVEAVGSAMNSAYADVQSKASTAVYGEPQGALESATSELSNAMASARSQLADLASSASSMASEAVETAASAMGDSPSSKTNVGKDEL